MLPDKACLALLAGIKYLNLMKTFPTLGGAIPVILQGLGMTSSSMGPNLLHSSIKSYFKSSYKSSSNKSSGEIIFKN